jgi:hypothetical protein
MTIHIQKFINKIKGAEVRGQRDISISLTEAKDLHTELTLLLLQMNDIREQHIQKREEDVITVQVSGGGFKE